MRQLYVYTIYIEVYYVAIELYAIVKGILAIVIRGSYSTKFNRRYSAIHEVHI